MKTNEKKMVYGHTDTRPPANEPLSERMNFLIEEHDVEVIYATEELKALSVEELAEVRNQQRYLGQLIATDLLAIAWLLGEEQAVEYSTRVKYTTSVTSGELKIELSASLASSLGGPNAHDDYVVWVKVHLEEETHRVYSSKVRHKLHEDRWVVNQVDEFVPGFWLDALFRGAGTEYDKRVKSEREKEEQAHKERLMKRMGLDGSIPLDKI